MDVAAPDHQCNFQAQAAELQDKVADLQRQLDAALKQLYGRKSERRVPPYRSPQPKADPAKTQEKRRENAATRAALPVDEVHLPVPPELLPCLKCGRVHDRGLPDNISDMFVRVPESFRLRRNMRQVLACRCGDSIVEAPPAPSVCEGSPYDASVYADVVVAKCADSIPLYRLAKMYSRCGVEIADSTLGDLLHRAAQLLEPLWLRILARIAQEDIVLADETTAPVQDKDKTRRAYIWAFLGAVLIGFKFSPSRSGETPIAVLGASAGTLVVDGYTGYNAVCTPAKRERSGCLAHVRRKFADARKAEPEAANEALDLILAVYKVEHEAKLLGIARTEKHLALRQAKSTVAMAALKVWLDDQQPKHLPSGPMGSAIRYAQNQWSYLQAFLGNAGIPVDNNASERALRTFALGRKNWLFLGNDVAGEHMAVLMSLVRSCEAAGVNPKAYLADVLMRIQTHPNARIDELLPDQWQPPPTAPPESRPEQSTELAAVA